MGGEVWDAFHAVALQRLLAWMLRQSQLVLLVLQLPPTGRGAAAAHCLAHNAAAHHPRLPVARACRLPFHCLPSPAHLPLSAA